MVSSAMENCGTDSDDALGPTHAYCSAGCVSVEGDGLTRAEAHTGIDARIREEHGQITALS